MARDAGSWSGARRHARSAAPQAGQLASVVTPPTLSCWAMAVANASAEEQLAWETRQRPRAAAAAFAGAVLALLGTVVSQSSLANAPTAPLVGTLSTLAEPGPIGGQPSARTPLFEFFRDHAGAVLAGAVLLGLSALAASGALLFMARASRSRTERFPRFGLYLALVGAAGVLLGSVASALGTSAWIDTLLATPRTVDAFNAVSRPAALDAGQIVVQFGGLVLAGSYVLVSLHAMRTGLLPRTWGILGIFAGFLVVLPVPVLSQVLAPVWLVAVGLLALGRWPGGMPPAWVTGRAEPWPSGAQMREERTKARGGAPKPMAEPDPEPVEARAAARPHPSSKKKRKRKRRH